jgi:NAD+ kinase
VSAGSAHQSIGILLKHGKPDAVEIASSLTSWLSGRGHRVRALGDPVRGADAVSEAELAGAIDLLIVLGGDGTLLRGAALVADAGVPILGVNLGHLGFLTSCAPVGARAALERALDGDLPLEQRMRLACVLQRADGERIVKRACNDVVVSQGALARLIELEALIDGVVVTRYRADGLIVSTPTGSTAYSLAAGGPILMPELRAMVITPICPHTLTNRPVVAPAEARVTVRLAAPADDVLCTVDGQWGTRLSPGDQVEIEQAAPPLYLYRAEETYFDVLRRKLRWGERESNGV